MARLIPDNTLEQVRAASDIVEIIGGYFPLKRAGGNHVALCPFHKENSPSFNVNPQRQIYHCFGCHAGGDVFKFIQEYEHIGFVDAVKRLAERAGIPLELEDDPRAGEKRREKDALLKVHEQLAKRWHNVLLNDAAGQPARDYLQARGVSAEAVEAFRLGFAPGDWEDTVNWAKAQQHEPRVMEQAGLVASKDGRQYGRFRARLMFPIRDEQSRVIGFSGRVLEADVKGAKYVNSPETPIFHKSKVIYGLDKARRPIIAAESVLICEGQLDTIACHMAGIENVVAPQGTALTADHARVLKRYANEVILCFDSDTAGQTAAVRSLDGLLDSELAIRVMTVPAPHDPDSFIREKGADAFRALMEAAPGFFDFYLQYLVTENDTGSDRGRQAVIRAMGEAVRKTHDAVLLDRVVQQTALAVGASAEAVHAEFARLPKERVNRPREEEVSPAVISTEPPSRKEEWLLRLAFHEAEGAVYGEWVAAQLNPEWVEHVGVRHILERAPALGMNAGALVPELDEANARLLTGALAADDPIPNPATQLADLVSRLRARYLDRRLAELTRLTAQPNLPEAELLCVLEEQKEIRAQKQKALPPVAG
ncbi:MAG: DNA primase [Verrucomicrobia subdivision 3 bacterium]|nr:DNA primase [Limisphaerales bacterium]